MNTYVSRIAAPPLPSPVNAAVNGLVLPRTVSFAFDRGRAHAPPARGLHGILPTPKWLNIGIISRSSSR